MADQGPPYLAAIYYVNEPKRIAGTAFAIRDGLLLTCAHVVRDALGLPAMPSEPPQDRLQLKFRFVKDAAEFEASAAPTGWFPGDSNDFEIGPLKDIAI